MVDIILHIFSESKWAVGLSGSIKQDILYQYYSLWNLKATNGRLIWMSPNFAYCWSTEQAFSKWLKDSSIRLYANSVSSIDKISVAKKEIFKIIKDRTSLLKYEEFAQIIKIDDREFGSLNRHIVERTVEAVDEKEEFLIGEG
jgi:hypothetical protein